MFGLNRINATAREFLRDRRGVAGIEFAFIAGFLSLAVLNVSDIGIYLVKRMQVENAAQMGTMAALQACDPEHVPATVNCAGLNAAVTAAIQGTSLGSSVTLQGAVSEGYYCLNASSVLQFMSSVSSKPANCSAAGMPALQPADYLRVQVTFSYVPLFSGISVAGQFATPIVKVAMVRMI
jgi:Flp pilus assembly protein TadG